MEQFKDLPANKQLDEILTTLKESPYKTSVQLSVYFYKNSDDIQKYNPQMSLMLNFLTDVEKYLEAEFGVFSLTFTGQLFIGNGGYTSKANAELAAYEKDKALSKRLEDVDTQSLKNQEDLNDLTGKLRTATWVAGVGTATLALIEIVKFATPYFSSCHCH